VDKMNKVLFVDDQQEILDLIQRKTRDESFDSYFAKTANEAIQILSTNVINVLITDIMMPDMSGLDLIMKAKEISPDTVRMVLSGNAQMSSVMDAINQGHVFKYLTKPWKIDDKAISVIEEALIFHKNQHIQNNLETNDEWIKLGDLKRIMALEQWLMTDNEGSIIMSSGNFKLSEKMPEIDYRVIDGLGSNYRIYQVI